jgi:hypothetical protein
MTIGLCSNGKFRLVKAGVLAHWCPGCACEHEIDVHGVSNNGHTNGWDGDLVRPSIGEPLKFKLPQGTCSYVLRAGVIYYDSTCWHGLAGHQRHLPELPRQP